MPIVHGFPTMYGTVAVTSGGAVVTESGVLLLSAHIVYGVILKPSAGFTATQPP